MSGLQFWLSVIGVAASSSIAVSIRNVPSAATSYACLIASLDDDGKTKYKVTLAWKRIEYVAIAERAAVRGRQCSVITQ